MLIHLSLRVTPDQLQVSIPEAGIMETKPNQVAYEKGSKSIVDFATDLDTVQKHFGERWEAKKGEITFSPIIDFSDPSFEWATDYFVFITALGHSHIRKNFFVWMFTQAVIDSYEYELWIQDYERIAPEVRQQFEYALQINSALFVERLSINGQPKELRSWKRKVEIFVRNVFIVLSPVLGLYFGITTATNFSEPIIAFLVMVLLLPPLVGVIGALIWMVTMRQLLPKTYLRLFLPKIGFLLPAKIFAKWLL